MLHEIMNEGQKQEFDETLDIDFAIESQATGRFRVNMFMQSYNFV